MARRKAHSRRKNPSHLQPDHAPIWHSGRVEAGDEETYRKIVVALESVIHVAEENNQPAIFISTIKKAIAAALNGKNSQTKTPE